jgi:Domain of unknown function (DUF4062)
MKNNNNFSVFISSTYSDLINYRESVFKVLNRLEAVIKGMEYFGSKTGTPKDECLKIVAESKVFICIIALKFGSVDEETGKSMVQLEYEKAQELKLPTLVYILDDKKQPVLAEHIDTNENLSKLIAFKEQLRKRHLISSFTTAEDLSNKIAFDLPKILEQEVNVNINDIPFIKDSEDNGIATLEKFKRRPKIYNGYSLVVYFEINSNTNFSTVSASDSKTHNLPLGETFWFKSKCYIAEASIGEFNIFAHGAVADALEAIPRVTLGGTRKIKALVSLAWGVREDIHKLENGVSRVQDTALSALLAKEILE